MKIKTKKDLKVGDLVKVDYVTPDDNRYGSWSSYEYRWTGMCNWGDGYKFSFIILTSSDTEYKPNDEIVWTIHDLRLTKAEVISESR